MAGALAAVAGALLASLTVADMSIAAFAVRAFAAMIVGGVDSLGGALLGGISIGVVELLAGTYLGNDFRIPSTMVVLMASCCSGLQACSARRRWCGRDQHDRRRSPDEGPDRVAAARARGRCGRGRARAAPTVLSPYWTLIATQAVLAFAVAAPLNMLTGNAGQFSLGNAAFLALGAYTGAYVVLKLDYQLPLASRPPPWSARSRPDRGSPGAATAGCLPLDVDPRGAVHRGVRGAEVPDSQFGAAGAIFPPLQVGGVDLSSDRRLYWVLLGFAVVIGLVIHNVMRSGYGRALEAVKARDVTAAACGIPVSRLEALGLVPDQCTDRGSGSPAGLPAGSGHLRVLHARPGHHLGGDHHRRWAGQPRRLGPRGGLHHPRAGADEPPLEKYGGDIGASNGGLLSHPLELQTIVYGAIIIAFIIFRPEGLIGVVHSLRRGVLRLGKVARRG